MKSAVMAAWLFTVSLGNQFTAQVNRFIMDPATGAPTMSDFNYYMFFAYLMFGATAIFSVVSLFYKGKTYLQSQEPDEVATEPMLGGGAPT
jgi:POT family proton-dependent oligopeptide transporter